MKAHFDIEKISDSKHNKRLGHHCFGLTLILVVFGFASQSMGQSAEGDKNDEVDTRSLGYFEVLHKNNIFDPNRRPYVAPKKREERPVVREPEVDTFKLTGVMTYEGKSFALFDGSSSSFRGKRDSGDTIENLKIAEVGIDKVILRQSDEEGENGLFEQFQLKVGQSLSRTDGGEWKPYSGNSRFSSSSRYGSSSSGSRSSSTSSNPSRSISSSSDSRGDSSDSNSESGSESADESDILKMLLERRKKELGQ